MKFPFKTKRITKIILSSLTVVSLVTAGFFLFNNPKESKAGWWNDDWSYRKALTINGSKIAGNLTNFPVLVSLTDTDLSARAQADGDDIVFTDATGQKLKHEIEQYASSSGALVAWVKIPVLVSATDISIYMYYGNVGASSQEEPEQVWDDNYKMVQHLKDGGIGTRYDSTSNNNDGIPLYYDGDEATTTGKIGRADYFDGTDRINNGHDNSLFIDDAITIEYWLKGATSDQITDYTAIISKGNGSPDGWMCDIDNYGPDIRIRVDTSGGSNQYGGIISNALDNSWHHIVWVLDNGTKLGYKDGVKVVDTTYNHGDGFASSTRDLIIAQNTVATVDEVRIANKVQTTAWIQTSYNNQNDPASFLSSSSEETGPGPIGFWSFDEGYGSTAHDNTANKNNGTISGATWQDESMCVSGKCLWFDGVNDVVNIIADNNSLNYDYNEEFTVSLWFKLPVEQVNTTLEDNTLIEKWVPTGPYPYAIRILNQTNSWPHKIMVLRWDESDSPLITSKTQVNDNKWHHLVFKRSNDTLYLYIDGRDEGSTADITNSTTANDDPITIGERGGGTNDFSGYLDEIKIYPYARTADQIKADYAAGLAGQNTAHGISAAFGSASDKWMSDGLVGYWPMDESATTSGAADLSGNGNTGTFYGHASTTAGRFGNSGIFDGTSDSLIINSFSSNSQNHSICMWVNKTDGRYLFDSTDNAELNRLTISIGDNCSSDLCLQNNSIWKDFNATISSGAWHHVCVVLDSSTQLASGYVDGVFAGSVSYMPLTLESRSYTAIGSHYSGDSYGTAGKLDEVRIYNRALSAGEVRKLYEWAPSPVGHWMFDEKQGTTAYDTSVNGLHNYFIGSPQPTWTLGKYGNALSFNSGGYLRRGDSILFRPPVGFTAQAWIKREGAFGTWSTVAIATSFESGGTDWLWWLGFGSSNMLCFMMNPGDLNHDDRYYMYGSEITDQNWHHVAEVYDGTAMKLYIDGLLDTYYATTSLIATASSSLTIGANYGGDVPFVGKIDDVRIYNYARTQKQILEDMDGGKPSLHPVLDLNFDEGYGATAHDSTIYGNNGTLTPGGGSNSTAASMWALDGKFGKAIEFDGGDDYIDLGAPSELSDLGPLTISAWVYPRSLGGGSRGRVVDKATDTAAANGYFLNISSTNTTNSFQFWRGYSTTAMSRNTAPNTVSFNTWQHIVVTWDGTPTSTGVRFYKNGEETGYDAGVDGQGNLQSDAGSSLRIGNTSDTFRAFDGFIDEVKIYNYALSAEEIKKDFNQGMAAIIGSLGGPSSGGASSSNSALLEYCVPGSTDYCAGPVGEWKFDEMTGNTAYDTSGNGNDGTLDSTSWSNLGKIGSALNFNNSASRVNLAGPNLTNTFTASFWIYPSGNYGGPHGLIIDEGQYWGIHFYDFNSSHCSWKNAINFYNGADNCSNTNITENQWHHIAIVDNAGATTFYLDGRPDGTAAMGAYQLGSFAYFGNDANDNAFLGKIDNVRVYNYARTPAQIAYEYNRGKPVAYWKFDECSGGVIHDSSGNGNNGTLNLGTSGVTATGTCASSSNSFWSNGSSGKKNSAGSFDGTDDYVDLNSGIINPIGNSTFSFWAKNNGDMDSANAAISVTPDNIFNIYPDMDENIKISLGWKDWSFDNTSHTKVPIGTWAHYVVVIDTNLLSVYLNGNSIWSSARTGNANSPTSWQIGSRQSGATAYYNGQIDEVKIWNYALTAEQIKADYAGGAVRFAN